MPLDMLAYQRRDWLVPSGGTPVPMPLNDSIACPTLSVSPPSIGGRSRGGWERRNGPEELPSGPFAFAREQTTLRGREARNTLNTLCLTGPRRSNRLARTPLTRMGNCRLTFRSAPTSVQRRGEYDGERFKTARWTRFCWPRCRRASGGSKAYTVGPPTLRSQEPESR